MTFDNMSRVEMSRLHTTTPGMVEQPCLGSVVCRKCCVGGGQPNWELQLLTNGFAGNAQCVALPCLRGASE